MVCIAYLSFHNLLFSSRVPILEDMTVEMDDVAASSNHHKSFYEQGIKLHIVFFDSGSAKMRGLLSPPVRQCANGFNKWLYL